jgi:hypothetical protein
MIYAHVEDIYRIADVNAHVYDTNYLAYHFGDIWFTSILLFLKLNICNHDLYAFILQPILGCVLVVAVASIVNINKPLNLFYQSFILATSSVFLVFYFETYHYPKSLLPFYCLLLAFHFHYQKQQWAIPILTVVTVLMHPLFIFIFSITGIYILAHAYQTKSYTYLFYILFLIGTLLFTFSLASSIQQLIPFKWNETIFANILPAVKNGIMFCIEFNIYTVPTIFFVLAAWFKLLNKTNAVLIIGAYFLSIECFFINGILPNDFESFQFKTNGYYCFIVASAIFSSDVILFLFVRIKKNRILAILFCLFLVSMANDSYDSITCSRWGTVNYSTNFIHNLNDALKQSKNKNIGYLYDYSDNPDDDRNVIIKERPFGNDIIYLTQAVDEPLCFGIPIYMHNDERVKKVWEKTDRYALETDIKKTKPMATEAEIQLAFITKFKLKLLLLSPSVKEIPSYFLPIIKSVSEDNVSQIKLLILK